MRTPLSRKTFFLSVCILLALFSLNLIGGPFKETARAVLSPLQRALFVSGNQVAGFGVGLFQGQKLLKENRALQEENTFFQGQLALLESMREENERLRELLGFKAEEDLQLTEARIVSKDITQDIIYIDKGIEEGIQKGMPVIAPGRIAAGRIYEVAGHTASVLLLSHKESSVGAGLFGKDVVGVAKGQGGSAVLDFIPREKEVSQGDLVVTSVLGGAFPPGIVIGKVKKVEQGDAESFQRAVLDLEFSLFGADTLVVITNTDL